MNKGTPTQTSGEIGEITFYADRTELLPDGRVLISGRYFGKPMVTYYSDGTPRKIVYAPDAVEFRSWDELKAVLAKEQEKNEDGPL